MLKPNERSAFFGWPVIHERTFFHVSDSWVFFLNTFLYATPAFLASTSAKRLSSLTSTSEIAPPSDSGFVDLYSFRSVGVMGIGLFFLAKKFDQTVFSL